jgi:serine/threonine-protein kinase
LGIVLFECLSGASPYVSNDGAAVATQVLAGKVRPLQELAPELPAPLVQAVERALRRDLGHRYHDMRALARGLVAGALASGIPVPENPDPVGLPEYTSWRAADRVSLGSGYGEADKHAGAPSDPRRSSPSHRFASHLRHWKSWSIALALVCLSALTGAWLLRSPVPKATGASRLAPPQPGATLEPPRQPEAPKPVVESLEPALETAPAPVARPPAEPQPSRTAPKLQRRRKPQARNHPLDVETEWK